MRVLVCGGRHYADVGNVWSQLDAIHGIEGPITRIISGHATGADDLAERWAVANMVLVDAWPANWKCHGNSAGPIRNRLMLEHSKPDLVLAFPGGNGTANMVDLATKAGVPVRQL